MTGKMVESLFDGMFWTRSDEMVEEIVEMGFEVVESYPLPCEYVVIRDDDDNEFVLYLGCANTTVWVDRVREW